MKKSSQVDIEVIKTLESKTLPVEKRRPNEKNLL